MCVCMYVCMYHTVGVHRYDYGYGIEMSQPGFGGF
jgi:hypothetical protein